MNRPDSPLAALTLCAMCIASCPAQHSSAPVETVQLRVDATSAHRHLIRSELLFDVEPGERVFWSPEWIPGVPGATGQVANLAGVRFENELGEPLEWRRSSARLNRFVVEVPAGISRVRAKLTYLANQPTRLSAGVDSFGTRDLLALNFNTCVLYPEGENPRDLQYSAVVKLPAGWNAACALEMSEQDESGWVALPEVSLERLIDSPLIAGRHFQTIDLSDTAGPSVSMHVVSDRPEAGVVSPRNIARLKRLVPEAIELAGEAPFDEYAFLLICSDRLPRFGLEHLESSINCVRPGALADDQLYRYRPAYLLPHELMHAWCGKHRLPMGMVCNDYHSPLDTELLWVYEGLTQYLMQVVAVRSGQVSLDEHLEYLAYRVSSQLHRAGRAWRPLADTARCAPSLRGGSRSWADLRRGQDYYDEGALFWMEVDGRLRDLTDGRVSIDDFCAAFFSTDSIAREAGYDVDEIVQTLESLADDDWRGLIRSHIYAPRESLALDGVHRAGLELLWSQEKSSYTLLRERVMGSIDAADSLGLTLSAEGRVKRVAPDGPADLAGMRSSMTIKAINRRAFSAEAIQEELQRIDATGAARSIELIVQEGDEFDVLEIAQCQGLREPVLSPVEGASERLSSIFGPRRPSATRIAERASGAESFTEGG